MSKGNSNRIVLHEGKGVSTTLCERLTPVERKGEIDELLGDLRGAKTRNEGKRIRRALRARGIYVSKLGGIESIEGSIANVGKPAPVKGKGKGKGKGAPVKGKGKGKGKGKRPVTNIDAPDVEGVEGDE